MKAMFVNEEGVKYAQAIVGGYKPIETRSKNMLAELIGERVAVISTGRHHRPLVIGYVTITKAERYGVFWMDAHRELTLIPEGSRYDTGAKWCYFLENPETCEPYELPATATRHGRSWAEWND